MLELFVIFTAAFFVFQCAAQEPTPESLCSSSSAGAPMLILNLNSKKNQSGEWTDTFTARTEYSNSSDDLGFEVRHKVFECEGKRVFYIRGISKGKLLETVNRTGTVDVVEEPEDTLRFHHVGGRNVGFMDDGVVVYKKNYNDQEYSVAFTNRPLRTNEIFEIMLQEKGSSFGRSLGFGVMSSKPDQVDIYPSFALSPHAWMYQSKDVYSHGSIVRLSYGKNLDELKVRNVIGVMMKGSGDVHFFVNGVDQGPAVHGVSSPVYGVVELAFDVQMAMIVFK